MLAVNLDEKQRSGTRRSEFDVKIKLELELKKKRWKIPQYEYIKKIEKW